MSPTNKDDPVDPSSSASAPDLQILGDEVTLQPSGYVVPAARDVDGKEEALMDKFASFRAEPLQSVSFPPLYVQLPD